MNHSTSVRAGRAEGDFQPYLKESVRSFFEGIPWNGHPLLSSPSSQAEGLLSGDSPMRMRVSDFFATVPWDGKPIIAMPIAPLEIQSEASQDDGASDLLTLEGFFDSF